MKFGFILLFILTLFPFLNCSREKTHNGSHQDVNYFINGSGNKIHTGVPVKIKGTITDIIHFPTPFRVDSTVSPSINYENRITAGSPVRIEANGVEGPLIRNKTEEAFPFDGRKVGLSYPDPVLALSPQVEENKIDIRHWSINQNMLTSSIWTMLQDKRGEFWFGSMGGGAIRFNGIRFEHFTEREGLGSNHVFSMLEDREGNLWFGTRDGGVSKFDGSSFIRFTTENGLLNNFVLCMLEDSEGNLWFGTRGGLCKYDGAKMTHYTTIDGLAYNEIISIFEDSHQRLWIGTGEGHGVHLFDGSRFVQYNIGEGKGKNDAHAIIEDRNGNIWFGTWGGGVTKYDGRYFYNYNSTNGLNSNNILSMVEDESGSIWMANMGGGVTKFDGTSFRHLTTKDGLSSNNVRFIFKDENKNIWACTLDRGINRININGFNHFNRIQDRKEGEVGTIISGDNRTLWMSTDHGFNKFDGQNFTHFQCKNSLIRNGVITLMMDSDKRIWLGTGGGVSLFDGQTIRDFTRAEGLLAGDVRAIHQDKNGNIWFGTYAGGVIRFNGEQFLKFSEDEDFTSNDVITIYEDSKNNLWFGTLGGGVSKFNGSEFIHYTTNEGLSHNYVRAIIEDNEGNLWFGTENGLDRYDGQQFERYTTKNGLVHNYIYALAFDRNGNLLVKTQKGISLLTTANRKKENEEDSGFIETHFISFAKEDGLSKTNLSPGNLLIDQNNNLWSGAVDGLKKLNLNQFSYYKDSPKQVKVTNLQINQSYVDFHNLQNGSIENEISVKQVIPFYNLPSKLKISYFSNHLTFHFSAIDWRAPQKIYYSFILEGIDKEWSPPQQESKVDYRNLQPGNYVFKLRAKGIANTWSRVTSFSFSITPPLWKSWWAKLSYTILLIFLMYKVYRFQLSRKLAISEGQKLKEINDLKNSIYTNITHEFRTPLTIINGMVENMVQTKDKKMLSHADVIKKQSNKLLSMVNQLLQLSKLEVKKETLILSNGNIVTHLKYLLNSYEIMANNKNIDLEFQCLENEIIMEYDSSKLETIVSNVITNALKFTPDYGKVIVSVCRKNNDNLSYLNLKVSDNGIGINQEELPHIFNRFHRATTDVKYSGTGIGLALVKELVTLMNGQIYVISEVDIGTTISILLPIRFSDYGSKNEFLKNGIDISSSFNTAYKHDDKIMEDSDYAIVLIVEDNIDIVNHLQNCINDKFKVVIAINGEEGMVKALEIIPDIIITDVMMPGISGFELCQSLKEDHKTNHIPIIMLTAMATTDQRLKGFSSGADAYLTKPFEKKELLVRIDQLLRLRKTLQHKYLEVLKSSYESDSITTESRKGFIFEVEQKILANLSNEEFSVNELAELLHLSQSQLNRKIKASSGMSTTLFIRHLRLLEARKLLQNSDSTISEILYQVGFNSPAYFSQAYKNEFGYNPSEEKR